MASLRQARKARRPRARGTDRRGQIPHMMPIAERPAEVATRTVPGHWEGDLIKGARNGSRVCENAGRIRTEQFVLAHVTYFIDLVDCSNSFGSRFPLRCSSIRCIFHHMIPCPMVTMLRLISS